MLHDLLMGARFLVDLPRFLRHPVTIEEARATLNRRFERREENFLSLVKRTIYDHPPSPYRALLQHAGCEPGDLARLVRQAGIEGALQVLLRHGVYLTVNEFKGRSIVRRGSATVSAESGRFRNPLSVLHGLAASSGSRGRPTVVPLDLHFVREMAVTVCVAFDARQALDWVYSRWAEPGQLGPHLLYPAFGIRTEHWFSPLDPAGPALHARYRWSGRALRWGSRLAGVPLQAPEPVTAEAPEPILAWLVDILRSRRVPLLVSYASNLVRLSEAARRAGIDLSGGRFMTIGEPLTPARATAIRQCGADVTPAYGTMEVGFIAQGCTAPETSDDAHVYHDLVSVVATQSPDEVPGLPAGALFVSSLQPSAPLVLLNVSLGDQATLTRRNCGCPLAGAGWPVHVHTIRSFEKLTAGGMSFLDADLIRVLEEVLPARFGGTSTDYQLVEEETGNGVPVVRLLVHPDVGPLDDQAVAEAFLEAIGSGSGSNRVMSILWRSAGLLHVERKPPLMTTSGKILHLHVERQTASGPSA